MFRYLLTWLQMLNDYRWRGIRSAGTLQQTCCAGYRQPAHAPLDGSAANNERHWKGDPQAKAMEAIREFPKETICQRLAHPKDHVPWAVLFRE